MPQDYPLLVTTTRTRTAALALNTLDLERLWPSWSIADKFSYLVVALASAAPVLNADPTALDSQALMDERNAAYAALESFINQFKSSSKPFGLAANETKTNQRSKSSADSNSEASNYAPEDDDAVEGRSTGVKTRAALAAKVQKSPRKVVKLPPTAAEESPSKRRTQASTAADSQASPSKRKMRAGSTVEANTPSKKRRTR